MNSATRHEFSNMRLPEIKVWTKWFADQGIEPTTVSTEGWVERDEDANQVRYMAFVGDRARRKPNDDGSLSDEVWLEERVKQLESAPLPFPVAA